MVRVGPGPPLELGHVTGIPGGDAAQLSHEPPGKREPLGVRVHQVERVHRRELGGGHHVDVDPRMDLDAPGCGLRKEKRQGVVVRREMRQLEGPGLETRVVPGIPSASNLYQERVEPSGFGPPHHGPDRVRVDQRRSYHPQRTDLGRETGRKGPGADPHPRGRWRNGHAGGGGADGAPGAIADGAPPGAAAGTATGAVTAGPTRSAARGCTGPRTGPRTGSGSGRGSGCGKGSRTGSGAGRRRSAEGAGRSAGGGGAGGGEATGGVTSVHPKAVRATMPRLITRDAAARGQSCPSALPRPVITGILSDFLTSGFLTLSPPPAPCLPDPRCSSPPFRPPGSPSGGPGRRPEGVLHPLPPARPP